MTTDEQINDFEKGLPDLPPTPEPLEPLEEIPQYRFKTEKEFIEEFGANYDDLINWTNDYHNDGIGMSYLFGEILEPDISETFYKFPSKEIHIDGFWISKEMITDKPLK